jgi:hypothetical protein
MNVNDERGVGCSLWGVGEEQLDREQGVGDRVWGVGEER